jgi:subtilisin family serine protease
MPDTTGTPNYYYSNGKRVRIVAEPGVYAVKFSPGVPGNLASLKDATRAVLRDGTQVVSTLPKYGIQVFRLDPQAKTAVSALLRDEAVEYVTPAFHQSPENADLMFVTDRFLVQFKPEITWEQITQLNEQQGVEVVLPLGYAPNGYLLRVLDPSQSAITVANLYYESGWTVFAHPEWIKKHYLRAARWAVPAPAAPAAVRGGATAGAYLSLQWHLDLSGARAAWAIDGLAYPLGSPTITVAILDNGTDLGHPEFSGSLADGLPKVSSRQYDFDTGVNDASPKTPQDNHGTAVAGIATAAGVKASGVAPGCRLLVARMPEYLGVAEEAQMFQWAADNGADVISCSWGPPDGIGAVEPLPDSTRSAIHYCATQGRAGLGIPILWAAGNGNESLDKGGAPRDGYATNPDVIAVGDSTSSDVRAPYSDFGPELALCAPSSGGTGDGAIFTTDRRGTDGYNPGSASLGDAAGDYFNGFGGTSAAAPLVAGVAALVLSANPGLRAAQVRDLLTGTAVHIGDPNAYDSGGHSIFYGYGRVNAAAAVSEALAMTGGGQGPQTRPSTSLARPPSISGPQSLPRSGAPPVFAVDPGSNAYYEVEVATRPELFDISGHGAERGADNFYGSWADNPRHASGPSWALPASAWARLAAADRLYYRVCAAAGPTGWGGYATSTRDADAASAPSILLQGA